MAIDHHDEFDIVFNTSQAETDDVTRMCIDYGLDYIDMGVDEGMGFGIMALGPHTCMPRRVILKNCFL